MLSYTLFALFFGFALTSAHPPRPERIPMSAIPFARCESEGNFYSVGDTIITSDKCKKCRCEFYYNGAPEVVCTYIDYLTPMCYNPVDNGNNACYRFTCPERNCKTPSGHVLTGDEENDFNDDGFCRCPSQSYIMPGDQWTQENGVAICEQEPTPPSPLIR